MKILVAGSNGQVAQAFIKNTTEDLAVIALGRPNFDICDKDSIEKAILQHRPDIVINPAAYTAVDKAEADIEQAFLINRDGAKNIAELSATYNIPLIHFSTDYVFNGASKIAYKEDDAVGPINIYGLSKLEGEWAVSQAHQNSIILRSAWIYSDYGNNFLKTMLRLADNNEQLKIVADQWGTPTSADFIATSTLAIAKQILSPSCPKNWQGIYHLVADGYTNWADFAAEIFKSHHNKSGKLPNIIPIAAQEYKTPAKRPQFSKLNNSKLKSTFDLNIAHWKNYLDALNVNY